MSQWASAKAKRVLATPIRIGWDLKRESGSHKILSRPSWPDFVFAFHDSAEIGPRMLARISKHTFMLSLGIRRSVNGAVMPLTRVYPLLIKRFVPDVALN
jgi:predicted RNA binding protein YcfA (HicA-like mRNA interferase family)